MRKISRYSKTIVALGGVLVVLGKALADGSVSFSEAQEILVAVAVMAGVYQVRNAPMPVDES